MDAWMAFVSIIAIIAIVVVAGGLIAFLGHMVIGAFDNDKKATKEVVEYPEIKQLSNPTEEPKEYDFEAINYAKAEQEKELAKKEDVIDFEDEFNFLEDEGNLEEIEDRLKAENAQIAESTESVPEVEDEVESLDLDEDGDLADLDDLLDEISNDIVDEEKEKNLEDNAPKMSDELSAYSLDAILNADDSDEDVADEVDILDEVASTDESSEIVVASEETPEVVTAIETEDSDEGDDAEEIEVDLEPVVETEEIVEPETVVVDNSEDKKVIEELKAQLAALNQQLIEARTAKTEVVTLDMTEEQCLERLATLEERLKGVKREYKINMKEYRPLKKVMNDLEKYQTKLRRKDTQVAKKKVALYGVNNYVDIDKEKAEKLANELDLLDGLRLSVSHCEEVINANKDRFPILEHTNKILEDQIAHIEADIETTNLTLQKIREKQGNDQ